MASWEMLNSVQTLLLMITQRPCYFPWYSQQLCLWSQIPTYKNNSLRALPRFCLETFTVKRFPISERFGQAGRWLTNGHPHQSPNQKDDCMLAAQEYVSLNSPELANCQKVNSSTFVQPYQKQRHPVMQHRSARLFFPDGQELSTDSSTAPGKKKKLPRAGVPLIAEEATMLANYQKALQVSFTY